MSNTAFSPINLSPETRKVLSLRWMESAANCDADEVLQREQLLFAAQEVLSLSTIPKLYSFNPDVLNNQEGLSVLSEHLLEHFMFRPCEDISAEIFSLNVAAAILTATEDALTRVRSEHNKHLLTNFPASFVRGDDKWRSQAVVYLTNRYRLGKDDRETQEKLLLFVVNDILERQEKGTATPNDEKRLVEVIDASMMYGIGTSPFLERTREIRQGETLRAIAKRPNGGSVFGHAPNLYQEQKKL